MTVKPNKHPPPICNENCYVSCLRFLSPKSSIGSCTYWLEVPNSPPIWTYLYHPIPSSSYLFYSTSIHNSSKTLHQQSWWRDQVSQRNAPRSERCYSPLRWCRNSSVKVETGMHPTHSRPYPCNRSSNLTGTSCFTEHIPALLGVDVLSCGLGILLLERLWPSLSSKPGTPYKVGNRDSPAGPATTVPFVKQPFYDLHASPHSRPEC